MDYRRNDDRGSDEHPMYSRLYIVCDRNLKEEQLREAFSEFGQIDDVWIPLDHNNKMPKGIAYIKFSKTTEAASALEKLNGKSIFDTKPLRVVVASSKSNIISNDNDTEKYRRLFIYIAKDITENEVAQYFQQYGHVEDVLIQRDRNTGEPKGFAYVKFRLFSEAARAVEYCDRKYRAIFASPKVTKRRETSFESNLNSLVGNCFVGNASRRNSLITMMNVQPRGFTRLHFMCSPYLLEVHATRLFNIVPGMTNFNLVFDLVRNFSRGYVEYANPICAQYALEKFNEFEYPPGQRIFVKPAGHNFGDHEEKSFDIPGAVNKLKNAINEAKNSETPDLAELAAAVSEASKIIKMATAGVSEEAIPDAGNLNYCSVKLPRPQPLADVDSSIAKRLFLICKPQPPPLTVLRDIFCRFGNLVNVYSLPNKTVGYARYATVESADEAMKALHGAEVCGVRMRVVVADDEVPPRKRIRLT